MKVLSVDLARVIWLFNTSELNPTGKSLVRPFADVASRYKFKKFPTGVSDAEGKGLTFSDGEFTTGDGVDVGVNLTIYSDGLVADTQASTVVGEEFLHDVAQWANTEHGLTVPDKVRVIYFSRFTVQIDKDIRNLDERLRNFEEFVSPRTVSPDGESRRFQFSGLKLWSADIGKAGAPAGFIFERKIGSPFEDERYYTEGPMTTDHLKEVVAEIEKLLS